MTGENDPITLKDAAQHWGFSVWTLRAEANRGRLAIYRIGKKDYTKPIDIREWIDKCRVEKKAPASISFQKSDNGLSATDRALSAQAALKETVLALRGPYNNTLGKSTVQNRQVRR